MKPLSQSKISKALSKNFIKYQRVYLLLLIALIIGLRFIGITLGMDFMLLVLALIAIFYNKRDEFVKDWWLPAILFYLYEILRALSIDIARILTIRPVVELLITLESKLFFFLPEIPTVLLQDWLHPVAGVVNWYDYILAFFYSSFYWFWLAIAFIIWIKHREYFKKYMYGLIGLSIFSVFVFYIFTPTAPPWWASNYNYLPSLERVMWLALGGQNEIQVLSAYGRNDFAAFPSLHAAWPFFSTLFLTALFKNKWLKLVFIVPLVIAFATWYGAEHYVIDSIAGFLLAYVAYRIAITFNKK